MTNDNNGIEEGYTAFGRDNFKEALAKWEAAGEKGCALSMTRAGYLHQHALGVPENYRKAAYWFKRASELGDAEAQGYLGVLYDCGKGVPQHYVLAYMWLNLSTLDGHEENENIKKRNDVARILTPELIAEAQDMALEMMETIAENKADAIRKQTKPNPR